MATFTAAKEKNGHGNVVYRTHKAMKGVIDYIYNEEKGPIECMKGKNINPQTAYEEMILNKQFFNKYEETNNRRMVVHFVQSFEPGELDAKLASEIADKFLQHEYFKGFNIAYATHTDKPHIHTHFVIDTVNSETGKMWHLSRGQLQDLKDWNDEICKEYNLSIIPKKEERTRYKARGQNEAEKEGRSWVKETELAVNDCMFVSKSKKEFISKMNILGYKVVWDEARTYITFEKDGHKIRNKTLDSDIKEGKGIYTGKYSKEALLKQFSLNRQIVENHERAKELDEQADGGMVIDAMDVIDRIIRIAARSDRNNNYPLQTLHNKTDSIQAKKERIKENEKGQGFDWEV